MTKDKKGITLVSLVITLIVMLILFGITIVSATVLIDNSKLTKLETMLYLIKGRASTLAEQYAFDADFRNLIGFSKLEPSTTPTVYNYIDMASTSALQANKNKIGYKLNSGRMGVSYNNEFTNLVKKIYPYTTKEINDNQIEVSSYTSSKKYEKIKIDTFLFVKWGIKECISQGVIKEDYDPKTGKASTETKNDLIDNNKKYAIVVYNLKNGTVQSVAYSLGFRNSNGVIEYTLDDLLAADLDEE